MTNVLFPPSEQPRPLTFFLEMEERLAAVCSSPLFFVWRVPPTVIFGRHQVEQNEVNVDFCRQKGIEIVQRQSGGGCVYADWGNLMVSYIVPNTHAEAVFQQYLDELTVFLKKNGFAAAKSQHNDVLIGDRKVSGNACRVVRNATIVHGTLLFDVDFEQMQQAITPTQEKLQKNGVQSVRQRVVNLSELPQKPITQSAEMLENALVSHFCTDEIAAENLLHRN